MIRPEWSLNRQSVRRELGQGMFESGGRSELQRNLELCGEKGQHVFALVACEHCSYENTHALDDN
jgi:hypothetical protein